MDELLQDFLAETAEIMEEVGSEIIAWEQNPSDRDRLDALFRCVHTIKGSSGFLDLPRIGALAHAAESVLAAVREGTRQADPELVSGILAIIDQIARLNAGIAEQGREPAGNDASIISAVSQTAARIEKAKAESPSSTAASDFQGTLRTIRVPLNLLDTIMNGVSDIVLARNEVARKFRETQAQPDVIAAFERLSGSIADMRNAVSQMRMQRIEKLFSALPRTVRDLSAKLGKRVELVIQGGEVEIDREMVEMIRDPLVHIVRNAIDHGLETIEKRVATGKPVQGTLTIEARQSGNQIVIEISDDGAGVALDKLVSRAIDARAITAVDARSMSDAEKLDLLFLPGLSTARTVTDISGRGVGMDVVRSNVERIGGVVEVENKQGRGFSVRMRVPMTLTIISGLTVGVGDHIFAIPRSNIIEIIQEDSSSVRVDHAGGANLAIVRGKRFALVYLEDVLSAPRSLGKQQNRTLVLVRPASGKPYALSVAHVFDQEELVIRPATPPIMAAGVYAGTTLPDSGRPMLLIDPQGVAIKARIFEDAHAFDGETSHMLKPEAKCAEPDHKTLLVKEFSGALRGIRLSIVDRVEDARRSQILETAGQWRVTVGDEIFPVFAQSIPDGLDHIKMMRMTDGTSHIAYPIADVVDIIDYPLDIIPASEDGVAMGVALIDGKQVEIIDPYWVFSQIAATPFVEEGQLPLCRIDHGDEQWVQHFLAPMIEAAGYRVILGETDTEVDQPAMIIRSVHQQEQNNTICTATVIRLRAHASKLNGDDDSIYRYDRSALMSALRAGVKR